MTGFGECSICTDVLENNLSTIPCGHIFHFECVKKCIQNFGKCPKCRNPCKITDAIKLFTENPLSNENEMASEFKDLFRQLNKVAETNNQNLKRIMKQLQEKEKECEALKKELQEEKILRETIEHALNLEKLKNQNIGKQTSIEANIQNVQQTEFQERKTENKTKIQYAKDNDIKNNDRLNQENEKNLLKFRPLPTKQQVIESDCPVIITYLGGSTLCIEINNVIIIIYPTKHSLLKITDFKKIDICIGASPDRCLIMELRRKFPNLIWLSSEDEFLKLFKEFDKNPNKVHLIKNEEKYTYPNNGTLVDIIPSFGWIIKCPYCTIYIYVLTIDTNHLKRVISRYGNFDIIITKPFGIAKNIVQNHFESRTSKTILLGGVSIAIKAKLYDEIQKICSNSNDFIILNEMEEFIYQKSLSSELNSLPMPSAPPEELCHYLT